MNQKLLPLYKEAKMKVCTQCASLTNRPEKVKAYGKKWETVCQECFSKLAKKANAEQENEKIGFWKPY